MTKAILRTAITGGIGSGKSFVCQLLQQRGIDVYDCDAAAKRLMRDSEPLRQQLTRLIGPDTYRDGQLNKAAVAAFMMQSEENTLAVNHLVHPAVFRDFLDSGKDGWRAPFSSKAVSIDMSTVPFVLLPPRKCASRE